jgi:hypothetical protein
MSEKLDELRQQMLEMQDRLARLEHRQWPANNVPELAPRPNGALTARLDASYQRNKPTWQAKLRSALAERYFGLSQGDNYERSQVSKQPLDLETLPRLLAADLTRETYTQNELASAKRGAELWGNDPRCDNRAKIIRLEVELAAYQAHTDDLLATTELPPIPDELLAKLGKAVQPRTKPDPVLTLPTDGEAAARIAAAARNFPPRA